VGLVKHHSQEGADLLKRLQLGDKMPMIVAFEHHQRHDLLGYPSRPAASSTSLARSLRCATPTTR